MSTPLGLRHKPVEAKPPSVPSNLLSLISVGTTSFIHVVGNKGSFFFAEFFLGIDHGSFGGPQLFFFEQILSFVVNAIGKDEFLRRQQFASEKQAEFPSGRDFWRERAVETQCFQDEKKDAWDFFKRVPNFCTPTE